MTTEETFLKYFSVTSDAVAAALLVVADRIPQPPVQAEEPEKPLTMRQAASRLAVSVPTIHRAVQKGELPCQRIGRVIRIRPDDLAAFAKPPAPEPPLGQVTMAMFESLRAKPVKRRSRRTE